MAMAQEDWRAEEGWWTRSNLIKALTDRRMFWWWQIYVKEGTDRRLG